MQANLGGSNPQTIPGSVWAVAVDGSRMYYATLQSSQISAANLDGSNVQTIAATSQGVPWAEVRDMAVYSDILYWTAATAAAALWRCTRSASRPPRHGPPATAQMLQAGGLTWRWARSDSRQATASPKSQRTGNARVLAGLRSGGWPAECTCLIN